MLRAMNLLLGCLLLSGCDQPDKQLMEAVLSDSDLKPMHGLQQQSPVSQANIQTTIIDHLRDPFQWEEPLTPDQMPSRVRERLESHALESLSLVGVLSDSNSKLALVKSMQGLHFIKVGQYIGLHEGVVVKILHDRIEIQEPETEAKQGQQQSLIMRAVK